MPSFPSYYLNNLERKRQRSRELREGLNEGMAGVLGGVDRLAQMQQALEEKGLRAEALQHGREIEAQNQARADQRFAWEGEDRERKNAQADQKFWLELRKSATQGNAALGGEPRATVVGEKPAEDDVAADARALLGLSDDPERADVERAVRAEDTGSAASPEVADIMARTRREWGEPVPGAEPPPPTSGFAPKPKVAPKKPPPKVEPPKAEPPKPTKAEPTKAEPPSGFRPTPAAVTDLQKQRGDVAKMRAASRALRDLLKQYDVESHVGPLDQLGSWIANKSGLQSSDGARIQSTIRRAFDNYRVAVTGASAGVQEMAEMKETIPNMGDRVSAIVGKLDADDAVASQVESGIDAVLGSMDVRSTPGAASEPSADATSDPQKTVTFADAYGELMKSLGRMPTVDEVKANLKARGSMR